MHCAYDFGPRRWEDIAAVNVTGSQKLLEAARKAGVESVVLISTLSAFPGCRSLYGKAKLEIESAAQSAGASSYGPGLVYSDNPGGMFGRLVRQVRGARFIPIIWGGKQVQYLLHDEDLGKLVEACLDGRVSKAEAHHHRPRARMGTKGDSGSDRPGAGQGRYLCAGAVAMRLARPEIPGTGRRADQLPQ